MGEGPGMSIEDLVQVKKYVMVYNTMPHRENHLDDGTYVPPFRYLPLENDLLPAAPLHEWDEQFYVVQRKEVMIGDELFFTQYHPVEGQKGEHRWGIEVGRKELTELASNPDFQVSYAAERILRSMEEKPDKPRFEVRGGVLLHGSIYRIENVYIDDVIIPYDCGNKEKFKRD
jgi:hypothetical protein